MSKLSPSRAFAMQGASVPGPPDGLPVGASSCPTRMTAALAAALCAGLHRKFYLAGRLRWTMDESVAMECEHYLWNEVARTAARENWVLAVGQETMRALAGLAVAEMLYPAKYGKELNRVKWFGKRIKLPEERVWPVWERTWRGRYQQAAWAPLERWTEVAASHIDYRQRNT